MTANGDLVWPNAESAANSDPWLIAHHDRIRLMRPRVLAVNFVHGLREHGGARPARRAVRGAARVLALAGHRDPAAPVFLDYQLVDIVDLTEPRGARDRNSAQFPRAADGVGFDYGALYELRLLDGLTLEQLTERGLVNEVWLLADHTDHSAPWETVEVKRTYDEAFRPLGSRAPRGQLRRAQRALDRPQPAHPVRQLRPRRRLRDGEPRPLAGADGDLRRAARTTSATSASTRCSTSTAATGCRSSRSTSRGRTTSTTRRRRRCSYRRGWRQHRLEDYVAAGGNVHFMPNGRFDYDLDGAGPVLSTIETWRQPGSAGAPLDAGRAGAATATLAPDCMGRWVVYWRQNMPGLGQHRARRRRPPDEELVAVPLLLIPARTRNRCHGIDPRTGRLGR